jgi:hypothetical protein
VAKRFGIRSLRIADVEENRAEAGGFGAVDIALLIVGEDAGLEYERKGVEHRLIGTRIGLEDRGVGDIHDGVDEVYEP